MHLLQSEILHFPLHHIQQTAASVSMKTKKNFEQHNYYYYQYCHGITECMKRKMLRLRISESDGRIWKTMEN